MTDRAILEKGEARILRMSYHANAEKIGKPRAAQWLTGRLIELESTIYGAGFASRCRALMREIEETEA